MKTEGIPLASSFISVHPAVHQHGSRRWYRDPTAQKGMETQVKDWVYHLQVSLGNSFVQLHM
jgi:hypothetical protein